MTNNIWAKTILSSYRYLERIADAIDRLVENKALNSFYMGGRNYLKNNISTVADSLINLSERKVKLINLKILCEMSLQKCEDKHAEILIEKYIDGDKAREISQRHELSLRTYFRRLNSAENEFTFHLNLMGYTDKKLASDLLGERWICEIYKRFAEQAEELDINIDKLEKLALV